MTDHRSNPASATGALSPQASVMPVAAGRGAAAGPEVVVLPDPEAVSLAAAERIAAVLRAAVAQRGRADFASTGGSTPAGIYRHLAVAPLRDQVPWHDVHLWWGDDRYVPADHPESNVTIADRYLIRASVLGGMSGTGEYGIDVQRGLEPGAPIPAPNIHPFPCAQAIGLGKDSDWCAAQYVALLEGSLLKNAAGWPVFDLVLVGVGKDGHVLSVFPGSEAFDRSEWALAVPAPTHIGPHLPRVTLNPAILDAARSVLAVAHGSEKTEAIGRVFGSARDERQLPAQRLVRPGVTWFLDQTAAADIRERVAAPSPNAAT